MKNIYERDRIKQKINFMSPESWWGDDFDVRFYLLSKLKTLRNKSILDVGGGIGIVSSEIDKNNLRINLDYSFENLQICKTKIHSTIQNICSSMNNLPFSDNSFDYVICSHLLEIAKYNDIQNEKVFFEENKKKYPAIEKVIEEIQRVLKKNGILLLTTPNKEYYKSNKLTFNELKDSLNLFFDDCDIFFYNTHKKLSDNRKLNLASVIPKFKSRFANVDKIIKDLIRKKSSNNYSVSFFVRAKK